MAVNYTPLLTDTEASVDEFNSRFQDLDDAIEDAKDGTAALSAPDITSFANAQHDHSDAANGGQIPFDNLDTTGATAGQVWKADGAGGGSWNDIFVPEGYKRGMDVRLVDDGSTDYLCVGTGAAVVGGSPSEHNAQYNLDPATAADWISGVSGEASNHDIMAYVSENGDVKLYPVKPNYTAPTTANRVATMRVNEPGAPAWDGTAGQGLGETTITYDTESGDSNVQSGMLLGVYNGSGYTTGRGNGSGAGGSSNYMTFVEIVSIDTGANTITVKANNIAFNDNDYLLVIERGEPIYLYYSSEWWRLLGGLRNDASSILTDTQVLGSNEYTCDEGTDYTTTNTSFEDVDSTNLVLTLTTLGGDVEIGFHGDIQNTTVSQFVYLDVYVDSIGARIGTNDGIIGTDGASVTVFPASFNRLVKGLPPGTHKFTLQWKVNGGTGKLYSGAGTTNADFHAQFWVREVQR